MERGWRSGYGKAGGCFADVMQPVHGSIRYHQEHALPTVTHEGAAYGGVVLRFHGVSNVIKLFTVVGE
jgi:hypothetical protein